MLGTTEPCTPFFGRADGMKAASAAGRPDGRRQAAGDFSKSSRRTKGSGDGLNWLFIAYTLGAYPR